MPAVSTTFDFSAPGRPILASANLPGARIVVGFQGAGLHGANLKGENLRPHRRAVRIC